MQDKDFIPTRADLAVGAEGGEVERLQNYLRKFGYLESPVLENFGIERDKATAPAPRAGGEFDENTRRALEQFQRFAGLEVTGRLDEETLRKMQMPRCGFPDTADFVLDGRKWDHTDLTYRFLETSPDLPSGVVRQAIREAFELWEDASSLTFREVGAGQAADIIIRFVSQSHGDGNGFDGPSGVLAHAFFPPPNGDELAGDAHFDEDETWSIDIPASGIDLVTVAAHEFGHSLGLAHSQVEEALMFPFYDGPNRRLHADDIAGIRQLYGAGDITDGGRPGATRPPTVGTQVLGELQRLLTGYPCIVQVHNRTPAEWQVSIVAGATRFFYQNAEGGPEGEPYTDVESGVNVETGESLAMRSDFPDRCVRRADTVIWVRVPGQNPVQIAGTEEVGTGECLRSKEYILAPNDRISFDRLRSEDLSELFHLKPVP